MGEKRIEITSEQRRDWADKTHLWAIEAILQEGAWSCDEIVFHGGTSLSLSWRSPRMSEDLDFLLKEGLDEKLDSTMERARKRVEERFKAESAGFCVESKSKKRNVGNDDSEREQGDVEQSPRLRRFTFSVGRPDVVGKVKVKLEFWSVPGEYIEAYEKTYRVPVPKNGLVGVFSAVVPAATLNSSMGDKMTALATRGFVKWRDIFDIWWLGCQTTTPTSGIAAYFLQSVKAYNPRGGKSPQDALRDFLKEDDEGLLLSAQRDLKPWFGDDVWPQYERLLPEMISFAKKTAASVADECDLVAVNGSQGVAPRKSGVKK